MHLPLLFIVHTKDIIKERNCIRCAHICACAAIDRPEVIACIWFNDCEIEGASPREDARPGLRPDYLIGHGHGRKESECIDGYGNEIVGLFQCNRVENERLNNRPNYFLN